MTRASHSKIYANQRGATLVHVAYIMLGLVAFSAFVFDFGVIWVSRRQAQNAADAAAHAGAVALALDDFSDRSPSGPAYQAAVGTAFRHRVWGQELGTVPSAVEVFVSDPGANAAPCPDDASYACVRVDIYRDAAHGSALPVLFGSLVGLTEQDVRATATAKVFATDRANCLKPWAVIDQWEEHWDHGAAASLPWSKDSEYDKYTPSGELRTDIPPNPGPDTYIAADGFDVYDDEGNLRPDRYGQPLVLRMGVANRFKAGGFRALALDDCGGPDCYTNAVTQCVERVYKPGDVVGYQDSIENETNDLARDALCNLDPAASWADPDGDGVFTPTGSNGARIVQIPLIDPEEMLNGDAHIASIVGFFISCPGDSPPDPAFTAAPGSGEVFGRIVQTTGDNSAVTGGPGSNPSALLTVALIR
jgi:hypothetical protein